ncbi:hypothetical protein BEH94_01140 [Candidatus Altiarchaeales archaeon WOR_SM1_SCG]|nr:hypothetical protein BEH94_01140 [Candidatus Altiarchaeales archaeon WOR_SM1_SCG]
MKIDMTLELKDIPGTLIEAIEPVSRHGGNIRSVLHLRTGSGPVPVEIIFEVPDELSLNLIKNSLEERKIRISEIKVEGKKYYEKETHSFMLIGHVIDTGIMDTIDRLNEVGMVSDLDVLMPSPDEKSSVMMNVDVDKEHSKKLMDVMDEISTEKQLLSIKSLD